MRRNAFTASDSPKRNCLNFQREMNARKGRKRAVCGRKRDNDMAPLSRHFPLKRRLFGETTSRDEVRWECNGGEGGIRTPDSLATILVFETSAFNRSATSPHRMGVWLMFGAL